MMFPTWLILVPMILMILGVLASLWTTDYQDPWILMRELDDDGTSVELR